jgi:hypothetical protein
MMKEPNIEDKEDYAYNLRKAYEDYWVEPTARNLGRMEGIKKIAGFFGLTQLDILEVEAQARKKVEDRKKLEMIQVIRPTSKEECDSWKHCWKCAIYLNAAAGDDFFTCFNTEKMKNEVLFLLSCF